MSDPMGSFRLEQIDPAGRDPRESDAADHQLPTVYPFDPRKSAVARPLTPHENTRKPPICMNADFDVLPQFVRINP